MFSIMVAFIALIAAVLILVILLQSGKGGGLAGIAESGATRQVLGTRQAPDMLEKATWTLGAIFIALCVLTNVFIGGTEERTSVIQERAQEGQPQETRTPGAGSGPSPIPGGGNQQSGGQQGGGSSGGGN